MRISLFHEFGALNSAPVFYAFSVGLRSMGHEVLYHDLTADVFVIWSLLFHGRMSHNKDLWNFAQKNNKKVIILEVGCLERGTTWKVGVNGLHTLPTPFMERSNNIDVLPWDNTGTNILICGQRTSSLTWVHGSYENWLSTLIPSIRKHSDRPIIFRPHPREKILSDYSKFGIQLQCPTHLQDTYDGYNFVDTLKDTWMVINPTSTASIIAVINGIPVITDECSLSYPMSTTIENIETPNYPDRSEWLNQICHTEWTIDELRDPDIMSKVLVGIDK